MKSRLYRRADDALAADLGEGKLALMGLAKGRYYALNPVGRAIWDFLEQPHTPSEIRAHLLTRFEVDEKTCERDLQRFLREMVRERLLEPDPEA